VTAVSFYGDGEDLFGSNGGFGMVVICRCHGAFIPGTSCQDILDTNVLLWYHCNTSRVANIHTTVLQEGKMADKTQFGNLGHSALITLIMVWTNSMFHLM